MQRQEAQRKCEISPDSSVPFFSVSVIGWIIEQITDRSSTDRYEAG
jgi:hypothetical protein